MSGLDVLSAIGRGELPPPPVHQLLGIESGEIEAGRVSFTLEPQERHYNPMGVVHGGVLSTILDSALGCAVYSTLPAGTGYTTIDLHVTFVRAVTAATGRLRAEGRSLHTGARMATAEGRLTDASGRLLAHGTATCLVLAPTPTSSR